MREKPYRVIGHRQNQTCPSCGRSFFCDDCGLCSECDFSTPSFLEPPYPKWPLPMPSCSECKGTPSHTRDCSVTKHAAAAWDGFRKAQAKKAETLNAFDRAFQVMESPYAVAVYKRPDEVRWFKTTEEACAFAAELESNVDPDLN